MDKYEGIINLSHYEPKYHPRMSMYKRSAQFAPFSALVGYDEQVQECSRLTDKRLEMDDESKEALDIVDTTGNYEKTKESLEKEGYTCK